jgi:hypothetical protein
MCIPDLRSEFFSIQNPGSGSRGQKSTGSRARIRSTENLKKLERNAHQDSFREIIDNKIFPESKLKTRKKVRCHFFTNKRFGCFGKFIILRNNICVLGKSLFIIHSQNITLEKMDLCPYTFLCKKLYNLFPFRAFCA